MTLSQRIILAKMGEQEQDGICPLCLNAGHKPGTCLLQHS